MKPQIYSGHPYWINFSRHIADSNIDRDGQRFESRPNGITSRDDHSAPSKTIKNLYDKEAGKREECFEAISIN